MTDYYEKQALIKHLQHRLYECAMNNEGEAAEVFAECAKNRVSGWIVDAPAADVAPVVHGNWVGIDDEPFTTWECDRCGCIYEADFEYIPNFCPNCGSDMRK